MNYHLSVFVLSCFALCQFAPIFARETITKAIAVIHPTKGNTAEGVVTFTQVNGGVHVEGEIRGIKPGEHGFHIHEFGDCSAPDATSAGAHFNPTNKRHGSPKDRDHHSGDLGNIVAGQNGRARIDMISRDLQLQGESGIIGRAVIVHEKRDDFKTQPTGDAGSRLGCGVIGVAKPSQF